MEWERFAALLLEGVVRRDEGRVAELCARLCRSDELPQWFFFRWNEKHRKFTCLWPSEHKGDSIRLERFQTQLEKGEILVDNRSSESSKGGSGLPRRVLVPLVYGTRLQGVLQGLSPGCAQSGRDLVKPSREKLRLLSLTWSLVELLDEKERLVYTDRLTGLYNAEYLVHYLENELARCQRYGRPLAIVFLDVDWFKNVNDGHGHLVGSHALREMAELFRQEARDADVVFRYGGDEFVVVLTETASEGALEMAERLRDKVEEHVFCRDVGKSIRLTVSAGVAVHPLNGSEVADLIETASEWR